MAKNHPNFSANAASVWARLARYGFLTTKSLSLGLNISRGAVIAAFDEIEATGIELHREYGFGGGASLVRFEKKAV